MLPTIEFTDTYMYVMSNKDDNKDIGAFINLAIYDENFDSITFNLVKNNISWFNSSIMIILMIA